MTEKQNRKNGNKQQTQITKQQIQQLYQNATQQGLRLGILTQLGEIHSWEDDIRNTYETFGWPKDPEPEDYLALYLRNPYARTIIDKPALTTWKHHPKIIDGQPDTQTQLQQQIQKLERNLKLWNYGERIDRVAGIGRHGLLILGLSDIQDTEDWEKPATNQNYSGLDDIKTLKPVLEDQIDEITYGDHGTERWGKPEYYHLDWTENLDEEQQGEQGPNKIHWSRAINVPSTRLLQDETTTRPRIEPVLNNILDIEKLLGSAAELAYRGADYGININWDPEQVDVGTINDSGTKDMIDEWHHDLRPDLRTFGAEVNEIGGDVPDITSIVEENVNAFSTYTGIPKKELRGNESGEVTGAEQDTKSYFGMIEGRRRQYAERHIVRPLIDRLIQYGILPEPQNPTYKIKWPDLAELDNSEIAEIRNQRSQVIQVAGQLIPQLSGDTALQYLKTGELPDVDLEANKIQELQEELDQLDVNGDIKQELPWLEDNSNSKSNINQIESNATRYSEGDVVQSPQGLGVVTEIRTEPFEGKNDDEIDASSQSPTYIVALKDGRVGAEFYKASQLEETEFPETDVENPEQDLKGNMVEEMNSTEKILQKLSELLYGNQEGVFEYPPSWQKSETPNRLILLKAWAGLGGRFTSCVREMRGEIASPDRFCADMKDRVLGWEGWRRGG